MEKVIQLIQIERAEASSVAYFFAGVLLCGGILLGLTLTLWIFSGGLGSNGQALLTRQRQLAHCLEDEKL